MVDRNVSMQVCDRQEKRKAQEEMERRKRELDEEKLRQQQLKRKSLRDKWLMEATSPTPEDAAAVSPPWATHPLGRQLETLASLQSKMSHPETQEEKIPNLGKGDLTTDNMKTTKAPEEDSLQDISKELKTGNGDHQLLTSKDQETSLSTTPVKVSLPEMSLKNGDELGAAVIATDTGVENNFKVDASEVIPTVLTVENIEEKKIKALEDMEKITDSVNGEAGDAPKEYSEVKVEASLNSTGQPVEEGKSESITGPSDLSLKIQNESALEEASSEVNASDGPQADSPEHMVIANEVSSINGKLETNEEEWMIIEKQDFPVAHTSLEISHNNTACTEENTKESLGVKEKTGVTIDQEGTHKVMLLEEESSTEKQPEIPPDENVSHNSTSADPMAQPFTGSSELDAVEPRDILGEIVHVEHVVISKDCEETPVVIKSEENELPNHAIELTDNTDEQKGQHMVTTEDGQEIPVEAKPDESELPNFEKEPSNNTDEQNRHNAVTTNEAQELPVEARPDESGLPSLEKEASSNAEEEKTGGDKVLENQEEPREKEPSNEGQELAPEANDDNKDQPVSLKVNSELVPSEEAADTVQKVGEEHKLSTQQLPDLEAATSSAGETTKNIIPELEPLLQEVNLSENQESKREGPKPSPINADSSPQPKVGSQNSTHMTQQESPISTATSANVPENSQGKDMETRGEGKELGRSKQQKTCQCCSIM
ncbi:paralemmin-3 isoform X2 [Latimeria chalumnae]|uniref:paralemmin-3 isoform X2 n=1 Tax=Latimeria chalumnae TaxID=7897 RepID=UPI0003C1183A|nr:PREDICTED: paralemmin-3-like isoform X2 [Latimeria chalumnae]|eukprot:XP_006008857.1 PREDICTED: paralemmin-3-like isoform X2 [Latimeria chalumnae]